MALLEVQGLSVAFGGSKAVDGITLQVESGQLVGLIGPNGAGKTTTVDAVTGFVPPTGSVTFGGILLDGPGRFRRHALSPTKRARLGLARTWQSAELFVDLTVMDNLRVAGERNADAALEEILESLGLLATSGDLVTALSHGQRKLVGVARALAASPKLVCMDEPAAGLDTKESEHLGKRIREIADHGTAVLLIDHDMGLVLSISDYVYVLDFGKVIAQGPPAEIRANDQVIEAYLGRRHKEQLATEATK
jgi:branched-chain amino acid transport system ATP-binding protein